MVENDLVDLLKRLVAVPSVNPRDSDDPAIAGEGRLGEFLAEHLEGLGFAIRWDERESGRPNVIASYGPADARRTVLFEAHMDTVGVEGMIRDPFKAVVEAGRLYGRGSCDTKGPMAAALHAMTPHLLDELAQASVSVVFVGAMGEESGNAGAIRLVEKGLIEADQIVVLEPTELAVVHAHKGALWFEVETGGRAGHGSNPAAGVSAILGMVPVVDFLQRQTDAVQLCNEILGRPTINIGTIQGGSAVNIVPDRCVVKVDRRVVPGEVAEEIVDGVKRELSSLEQRGLICSHDMRIIKIAPAFETSPSSSLVHDLAAGCVKAGVEPALRGAGWYSDAGPLAAACSEVAVFGPGSIAQAHTADEFIDLNSLMAGCEVLRHFLEGLCQESPETGEC